MTNDTATYTVDPERLTNSAPNLLDTVQAQLDAEQAVVIACPDAETAAVVTAELYGSDTETYHVEHYPATNDDTGTVGYIAVIIRRLHYDQDTGWHSTDIPTEPGIVLNRT